MNIEKLGSLRAAIEGDASDLSAGFALAKKDVKGFGAGFPGWVAPVGTAMLAAGAVVTGALTKMVFDAGKYGDSLDKMSLRTGVGVEALSELSYAVKISGSDVNALETSIRFLNRRMDESREGTGIAKDAFDKLGVSVVDSEGNMRDSIEVMAEVADGLVGLTSESERGATAMDIFGARSGPQLLPLLKQGSAGIEELRKKAQELGLTMSTEAAAAAAVFEDSLTDVRESAKMASFELGQVFLPMATGVIEKVTGMVGWFSRLSDTEQKIVGWGTAAGGALLTVSGAAMLLLPKLPLMIAGFQTLVALPGLLPITGALAGLAIGVGVLAAGYKFLDNAIADNRRELTSHESVTKAQTSNMAKIRSGIADWEKQQRDLTEAQRAGLTHIQKLNKNTGEWVDIPVAERAQEISEKIAYLNSELRIAGGDIWNVSEKTKGLTTNTKALGESWEEQLKGVNAGSKEYASYYDMLTSAFSDWTSITGEGYRASELQRIKYLSDFLATVEKDSKAWIGLTNMKTDLQIGMYAGFKAIAEAGTITEGEELGKRAVLDEDYLAKIQRNAGRRLANASESLTKESGMVKEFFDWEIFSAADRTTKLISERARQYAEESRLYDKHLADMIAGEERWLNVTEDMAIKELEMSNRGHAAAVASEIAEAEERVALGEFYLRNVERLVNEEFDLKKDTARMTQEEMTDYYQAGMESTKAIYDDFKPFFQDYNLDILKLDTWRADQMLAIEKELAKAKKEEIGGVYEDYATHLRETEEFWGVDKGFRNPYARMTPEREPSFSEQALYYGLSEAIAARDKLPSPAAEPVPSVYRPPAGATAGRIGQGDVYNINVNLENLYGGDESTLNNLAEDIARRIKGQNITI